MRFSKIAVVGPGAVGSYYGAMLSRAGGNVHFLLRTDFEAVRSRGVNIVSPSGNFNVRPHAARTPDEIGSSDLVVIALKATANDQFDRLLPPLVGPHTALLTLQNGLGNEEALAKLFPAEQILGGLCFVYLNRTAPGVVQHLGEGKILLGEFQRWPEPRTQDLASLLRQAGVNCKVTDNLARAHWEKLVWNIPFNGLGVASAAGYEAIMERRAPLPDSREVQPCLTTGQLLDGAKWETLVRELMQETIAAANGLGHALDPALADKMIALTRNTKSYKSSTVLDLEMGRPLELESLFLEPLRLAQGAKIPTPRLARLCQVLKQLGVRATGPGE